MLVSIRKASKTYTNFGRKRVLFSDVNIDISEGKVVTLTGSSGSGKSTLMNIMAGFETMDNGRYYYNGENVTNNKRRINELRQNDISIIPQGLLLIDQLNSYDNIQIASDAKKIQVSNNDIENYAKELEIFSLLDVKIKKLSLGERQRVAIIRALVCGSKLVIADEPTSALDHSLADKTIDLFCRIAKSGTAFFIITHDLSVFDVADTIYLLEDGVLKKKK